jgi:hypothetical protein
MSVTFVEDSKRDRDSAAAEARAARIVSDAMRYLEQQHPGGTLVITM